jgi:hypothetical protein
MIRSDVVGSRRDEYQSLAACGTTGDLKVFPAATGNDAE